LEKCDMPFVKRNEHGVVVAVSRESVAGCTEELATDDPAMSDFLVEISGESSSLDASDQHLIRVLEDVVDLLTHSKKSCGDRKCAPRLAVYRI
jgi:hypothetical protein